MNNYLLPLLSLALGLLGAFTDTTRKLSTGKKQVTFWGWVVAILIIISASVTIVNSVASDRQNKKEQARLQDEASQQRLLSLLSVSSGFNLSSIPYLNLFFNTNPNAPNYIEDTVLTLFPGFGLQGVKYTLSLDISSSKQFSTNGTTQEQDPAPLIEFSNDASEEDKRFKDSILQSEEVRNHLFYDYEPINNEINHLWSFIGYQSLTEFLFDFQPGRHIGTLTLTKQGGLSLRDIEKLETYIIEKGTWQVRVFLKNEHLEGGFLNIVIPIDLYRTEKTDGSCEYMLFSGAPVLNTMQFDPV